MKPSLPLFDHDGRVVSLLGNADAASIHLLIDQLLRLDTARRAPITLYVSSEGGSLMDGLKLMDIVFLLRSPVTAIGMGCIDGAGLILFATARQRWLLPSAVLSTSSLWRLPRMDAAASIGLGPRQNGNVSLVDIATDRIEVTVERRCPELSRLILQARDRPAVFAAAESLRLGLADRVLTKRVRSPRLLPSPSRTEPSQPFSYHAPL